jgi:hypothetical protein
MGKPVILVAGDKGGVGKSMVAMVLLDLMEKRGMPRALVDADPKNPDVWRTYHETMPAKCFDLGLADGWMDLTNHCEAQNEDWLIVNTAASTSFKNVGTTFVKGLAELERPLVTLWVINRQRDCLDMLGKNIDALMTGRLFVVRNEYWGGPEKFELFNASNLRARVVEGSGGVIDLPELADRIADEIYIRRLRFEEAMTGEGKRLAIGSRVELERWRLEAHERLAGVVDG